MGWGCRKSGGIANPFALVRVGELFCDEGWCAAMRGEAVACAAFWAAAAGGGWWCGAVGSGGSGGEGSRVSAGAISCTIRLRWRALRDCCRSCRDRQAEEWLVNRRRAGTNCEGDFGTFRARC